MGELDEVIEEFLIESHEGLDKLDSDFMALEDNPQDRDRLSSIFRTVHTIKGTSGFLALPKLEKVAHVGENLLVPLRDGKLELSHEIADSLLAMVDAIRSILKHIESDGQEGDDSFEHLIGELQSFLDDPQPQSKSEPSDNEPASSQGADLTDDPEADATGESLENSSDSAVEPAAEAQQEAASSDGNEYVPSEAAESSVTKAATPVPTQRTKVPTKKPATDSKPSGQSDKSRSLTDSSVRIDVDLLDKLMNLVGELVLARNQVVQLAEKTNQATLTAASQRLNLITTELQEGVMKTRMQPIRNAWNKLPRVVRDLSSTCGKKVEVRMEGADTELDKTILEAIKDPLTHIVRNSVDHGIESPEVRKENGKPEQGVLLLRAFHEGGQVNIEISDDGGGINTERVCAKAIEKGLITAEQAETMSPHELTNLVLLPGFSTAAKVTNVSGRGVGMDVVKTNIEKISGTLEIKSEPGKGTTLRIKIPLTLAIVPALIVRSGADSYAIPQVNLLELVRLEADRAASEIEFIHSMPVYRLRGELLPLIYLDEQLELRSVRQRDEHVDSLNVVVLQSEDRQFGLVVDQVVDTQEIVVKPLNQQLNRVSAYAGATIMGDGTVALILDVIGLAQRSNVLTQHRERLLRENSTEGDKSSGDRDSLLILNTQAGNRTAIRVSTIDRLEKFESSKIEQTTNGPVIQYRGDILPLVSLDGYGISDEESESWINAIVYKTEGGMTGVVVSEIVDIVSEERSKMDQQDDSMIINGSVTEILDLSTIAGIR